MRKTFLASALVMLCFFSCGDKKADTSDSKSGKTKNISGKYQVCDIDGFTGNSARFGFNDDGTFSLTYYSDLDSELVYNGKYKLSGDEVSLDFKKFETADEYRKASSLIREMDLTDEQVMNAVKMANMTLDKEPVSYIFSGDDGKNITRSESQHYYRKAVFTQAAEDMFREADSLDIKAKGDGYGYLSSDESRCENISVPDIFSFEDFEESMSKTIFGNEFERYTQEKGFTDGFDLSEYEWLAVLHDEDVVAFGIGTEFDSEICGISKMWYIDGDGGGAVFDEEDKPLTLEKMYEFYKEKE